jgi:hypothetical protein
LLRPAEDARFRYNRLVTEQALEPRADLASYGRRSARSVPTMLLLAAPR